MRDLLLIAVVVSLSQNAWDTTYENFTKCCTSASTPGILEVLGVVDHPIAVSPRPGSILAR